MDSPSTKKRRTADWALLVEIIEECMALSVKIRTPLADSGMQLYCLHQQAQTHFRWITPAVAVSAMRTGE